LSFDCRASIIAKVSRDHWMIALDAQTPGYGLAQHKGYGTRQHLACLRQIGLQRSIVVRSPPFVRC
jgi:ribonuclease HII